VVVVGSVNLDLVARSPRFPRPGETILGTRFAEHPGGKGLNQAVAAARSGARVALVGAVGDDRAGNELRELVRSEGINDTLLHTIPGASTGRALITIDETGENTIVVIPGANDALTVTDLPPAPVVLVQLEIPPNVALAALTLGREQRATTILNPAPATHARAALEPGADLVVPNEHELAQLGGVDVIRTLGARSVVVTRGAVGVDIVDGDLLTHIPPIRVSPVDTTGAGDAFCGALAARLAVGESLHIAARYAAAAGALATTKHGAVPSQPWRADIEAILLREQRGAD
jgi:ribokinase